MSSDSSSCPQCGQALSAPGAVCPQCTIAASAAAGSDVPTRKPRLVRWLIGLPVAFFTVLMLLGYLFNTPETEARWVARETIRMCWKEVQKPPKEGKPVHFTQQSECEKLEFDFKTQYGENP